MISVREVVAMVALASGVEAAVIIGRSQSRPIIRLRHLAAWLCVKHGGVSASATGRGLGGRDHTTMLSAVAAFDDEIATDQKLKEDADRLAKAVAWKVYAAAAGERDVLTLARAIYLDPRRAGMAASVFDVHALAAIVLNAWAIAEAAEELARLVQEDPENPTVAALSRAIAEEMAAMRGETTEENADEHAG